MDLDFLSGLIGGQGNGNRMLGMLLPLLLSGKGGDPSSLLSGIGGFGNLAPRPNAESNQSDFPPLFGTREDNVQGQNALWKMLGGLIPKSSDKATSTAKPIPDYPYELQYNRPYRPDKGDI